VDVDVCIACEVSPQVTGLQPTKRRKARVTVSHQLIGSPVCALHSVVSGLSVPHYVHIQASGRQVPGSHVILGPCGLPLVPPQVHVAVGGVDSHIKEVLPVCLRERVEVRGALERIDPR